MYFALRFLLLLPAALSVSAAPETDMPLLASGELPSLEVVSTQQFVGKGLYGYIDGGADLYHEYGFERVAVQEVRFNDEQYWVEASRMSDPPAALGIFTVSRGNCGPLDSLSRFSCFSPYSVQWALSKYFLRIANSTGSPAAQAGGLQLARLLSSKIEGDTIKAPPILHAAGGKEQDLLFIRGILGMQNGLDEWSPLVDGLDGFEAYIVILQDSSERTIVGDFRFKERSGLDKFSAAFSGTEKFRRSQQKGERRLVILESEIPADSLWSRLLALP
jgi:hypothetical protein